MLPLRSVCTCLLVIAVSTAFPVASIRHIYVNGSHLIQVRPEWYTLVQPPVVGLKPMILDFYPGKIACKQPGREPSWVQSTSRYLSLFEEARDKLERVAAYPGPQDRLLVLDYGSRGDQLVVIASSRDFEPALQLEWHDENVLALGTIAIARTCSVLGDADCERVLLFDERVRLVLSSSPQPTAFVTWLEDRDPTTQVEHISMFDDLWPTIGTNMFQHISSADLLPVLSRLGSALIRLHGILASLTGLAKLSSR